MKARFGPVRHQQLSERPPSIQRRQQKSVRQDERRVRGRSSDR